MSVAKLLSGTLCCAILALMAGLSGCNTVEGFGRDLGKLGDKIESKAQQKKHY
ncbi:MAG: entericidin A/B family lipoprotein [Gammaproteobacteria bacterium]